MRTPSLAATASAALVSLTVAVATSVGDDSHVPTAQKASALRDAAHGKHHEARKPSSPVPGPGETAVWLSDLDWTRVTNGFGPVEKDTSNGEDAAGDGNPITLDGEIYAKGLGVAAPSNVTYYLGDRCSRLVATVGIDDEVDDRGIGGSAVFKVIADGEKIFDSGVRYGTQWSDSVLETTAGSLDVDLDVSGVSSVELTTDPWYDGAANDHADWAGARVFCDEFPSPPPYVIVDAEPAEPVLLPNEPTTVSFRLRNNSDEDVTADVSADMPDGYAADAPAQVEIPANGEAQLPVALTRTTSSLADVEFRLTVGDQSLTVRLHPSDNWVRIASMSASSTFSPSTPDNLNDGSTDSGRWGGGGAGGWNDNTAGAFPDSVTATWSHPVELSRVRVYTLDSDTYPASEYGVRDYDLLVRVDGTWQTVAQVRGNEAGMVESTFARVPADQLQVKILDSNSGDYSRLVEVEAYTE